MTASSSACTPLFLNDAPHSTGNSFMAIVPLRTAARISSVVISVPATYFSMRWSSTSARPSIILSRYSRAGARVPRQDDLGEALDHLVAVLARLLAQVGGDVHDLELLA